MMDWIPNRLVYVPNIPYSPGKSCGSASLVSMGYFSRIRNGLKPGTLD